MIKIVWQVFFITKFISYVYLGVLYMFILFLQFLNLLYFLTQILDICYI